MPFLPAPRRSLPPPLPHAFAFGSSTAAPTALDNTESYKYLGVHFSNTGNPSDYMPQARRAMAGAYSSMRQQYCGLACGKHVRLQLQFFSAIVTSAAMYGGEACTRAQQRSAAEQH